MYFSHARDKIVKSWSGLKEDAVIKDVATKGEHIQLCIEYWSRKHKLSIAEYWLHFHDVVHAYVERLLSERLVCKAETVLRNVERDVACVYYQYACDCNSDALHDIIIEHLQQKEELGFAQREPSLKLNYELLQELRHHGDLAEKYADQLPRLHVETIDGLRDETKQELYVALYFDKGQAQWLAQLERAATWRHMIDNKLSRHICRWCLLANGSYAEPDAFDDVLMQRYSVWPIDETMYAYALANLTEPSDCLRNIFARAGYFFSDERADVQRLLRRICTTESYELSKSHIAEIPFSQHVWARGYPFVLLKDIAKVEQLEQMLTEVSEADKHAITLILALKAHELDDRNGFQKITEAVSNYLRDIGVDFTLCQPLLDLLNILSNDVQIDDVEDVYTCGLRIRDVDNPYIRGLRIRLLAPQLVGKVLGPYDLLKRFRKLNFLQTHKNELTKVFADAEFQEEYGAKYQLNYVHYLKQQRGAFGVYFFLTDQLRRYGHITRLQLSTACQAASRLAVQISYDNKNTLAHCVAFCELLGFNTQVLRSFVAIHSLLPRDLGKTLQLTELITHADSILMKQLQATPNEFPLQQYSALMQLAASSSAWSSEQWCKLLWPYYARSDDWWHVLLLLQYFDLPQTELRTLVPHFQSSTLAAHIMRALTYEPTGTDRFYKSRRRKTSTRYEKSQSNSSGDTRTSSNSSSLENINQQMSRWAVKKSQFLPNAAGQLDLFAIILLSNNNMESDKRIKNLNQAQGSTSYNLLKNCISYEMPVLAVLSATIFDANLELCWLVWLAVSVKHTKTFEQLRTGTPSHELAWQLIVHSIEGGFTDALYKSYFVFFELHPILYLWRFFQITQAKIFDDVAEAELRRFLLGWSNEPKLAFPFGPSLSPDKFMQRCIHLMIVQLKHNFESTFQQEKYLDCICRSDFNEVCELLDFRLLSSVFASTSVWMQRLSVNYELLTGRNSSEYFRLLTSLIEAKAYQEAIQLSLLLQSSISDIIYFKWVHEFETDGQLQEYIEYERLVEEYALPPTVLVNFFLHVAYKDYRPSAKKYDLLKNTLNIIKRHHLFPNESFNRDHIEYKMVLCYVQLSEDLPIYHSEYYEQIMLNERCVLYKTFGELMELAGVEDIDIASKAPLSSSMEQRLESLLNELLHSGDIVEALRIQRLFDYQSIDLRCIVFCMALAEGITTVSNLSSKERRLLSELDKSSFVKFDKLTLSNLPAGRAFDELSESSSVLDFEEIPPKEKQETLEIMQGVTSKLTHGTELCKRITLVYRAAMHLDKNYIDVLRTKDICVLLKSASEEECLQRLLVIRDVFTSTRLTAKEIAELLAQELTTCIARPRFYIFNENHQQHTLNPFKNANLWGYDIDREFHLFLDLAPDPLLLGNCLLSYCDALIAFRRFQSGKMFVENEYFRHLSDIIWKYGTPTSLGQPCHGAPLAQITTSQKKQNIIYVELLIKAHECFVHECSMEGISDVLQRAKTLNAKLTHAKSWKLIVRMLVGIGRYREMSYCFDTLIENEQFESLLGQFDENEKCALRQGILTYLNEFKRDNAAELLKLVACHFCIYKELAAMWEQEADALLAKTENLAPLSDAEPSERKNNKDSVLTRGTARRFKSSAVVIEKLHDALNSYTHATEYYLQDNKLRLATQCASKAELVAMQIDLATKALYGRHGSELLCIHVLNMQSQQNIRHLINTELSVPQALILGRAYGYDINWSEALLSQYILLQRAEYLSDYVSLLSISDSIIEQTVKGYLHHIKEHGISIPTEQYLQGLVELINSVTVKYKLASMLGLKQIILSLINGPAIHYLRDTKFGRTEGDIPPDT